MPVTKAKNVKAPAITAKKVRTPGISNVHAKEAPNRTQKMAPPTENAIVTTKGLSTTKWVSPSAAIAPPIEEQSGV